MARPQPPVADFGKALSQRQRLLAPQRNLLAGFVIGKAVGEFATPQLRDAALEARPAFVGPIVPLDRRGREGSVHWTAPREVRRQSPGQGPPHPRPGGPRL